MEFFYGPFVFTVTIKASDRQMTSGITAPLRHRAGIIQRLHKGHQFFLLLGRVVRHFVADTPHHHTGVITIAADKRPQITLPPCIKIEAIVELGLGLPPTIEGLIHHEKAHLVGHPIKLRCKRIVRRANRIDTHVLQ